MKETKREISYIELKMITQDCDSCVVKTECKVWGNGDRRTASSCLLWRRLPIVKDSNQGKANPPPNER